MTLCMTFKSLANKYRPFPGNRDPTSLMQRLSVAIQRENAASVLGTVNSSVDLDVVFYL